MTFRRMSYAVRFAGPLDHLGENHRFAHKIIRDLFSGEPDDRYIECVGLLLDHSIECRDPIGCDRLWAGPS